jgi:hypothetical protein
MDDEVRVLQSIVDQLRQQVVSLEAELQRYAAQFSTEPHLFCESINTSVFVCMCAFCIVAYDSAIRTFRVFSKHHDSESILFHLVGNKVACLYIQFLNFPYDRNIHMCSFERISQLNALSVCALSSCFFFLVLWLHLIISCCHQSLSGA